MQFFLYSIVFLLALIRLSRASFYDNPKAVIPEGGTPVDELERKWGTDVRLQISSSTIDHRHIWLSQLSLCKFDTSLSIEKSVHESLHKLIF